MSKPTTPQPPEPDDALMDTLTEGAGPWRPIAAIEDEAREQGYELAIAGAPAPSEAEGCDLCGYTTYFTLDGHPCPTTDAGRWLTKHRGLINADGSMRGDSIDLFAAVVTIEKEASRE